MPCFDPLQELSAALPPTAEHVIVPADAGLRVRVPGASR